MPLPYIGFIKIINNWIWKNKKFCENLEKEQQQILTDVVFTKEEIKQATSKYELMILSQIQQARKELLEIDRSKQKIYVDIIKYYHIFG